MTASKLVDLDLTAADPPVWRVLVENEAYGPYTLGQMNAFIQDGRVTESSEVAKGALAPFAAASAHAELAVGARDPATAPAHEMGPAANYIVVARLSGSERAAIVAALNELGKFAETDPDAYVLRSRAKLAFIRRTLADAAPPSAKILIVDASRGRLAWCNLGPTADAHVQSVWDADLDDEITGSSQRR